MSLEYLMKIVQPGGNINSGGSFKPEKTISNPPKQKELVIQKVPGKLYKPEYK